MGFIYKITNILTDKCYIGETKKKNPELRWNEHKQKISKGIGCPALQNAVKKYGIDKFTFKVLIICFDEDRYKFEIEYIKKYNSIAPNGYNLTTGGEGGGFYGKKHSQETIDKLSQIYKERYINNPQLKQEISERQKIVMNTEEVKNKIKNGIKQSEKWKNAKLEKRIGNTNNRKQTYETKNKISNSVLKYYSEFNKNNIKNKDMNKDTKINKHRQIMAVAKGIQVQQCDINMIVINKFISLSDASRQTGISKTTIQNGIKNPTKLRCGFIWKKIE
jgi:group I intron endonuclease